MRLDIINKFFTVNSTVDTIIASSHNSFKAIRDTNFASEMNSVLRTPSSLILIILMNIITDPYSRIE